MHFSPGLESLARRSLQQAELSYAALARHLKPPRGRIDLVVADNRDFANGYATTFPTNRIVVYAMPPFDSPMLRSSHDWLENLITHELVHIFHLDRVGGVWSAARLIFGRNPSMMPNLYSPSWLREGLAIYYESVLTGSGRLSSAEHHMLVRGAAEGDAFPGLGDLSLSTSRVPEGQTAYVFGAQVVQQLAIRGGAENMDRFVASMSASLVPWLSSGSAKRKLGVSFGSALRAVEDSIITQFSGAVSAGPGWTTLVDDARVAWHPRWLTADTLLYARSDGRSSAGVYSLTLDGATRRIARRNGVGINAPGPNGSIVFAQPEFTDPYTVVSDLWLRDAGGNERRLTHGARLFAPSVRGDGEIVAVQTAAGRTSIVRVSPDGSSIVPLLLAGINENWADPVWSPDGSKVAAVRRRADGRNAIVITGDGVGPTEYEAEIFMATPAWLDNNRLVALIDAGRPQIAELTLNIPATRFRTLTAASTGVLQPSAFTGSGVAGVRLAAVEYRSGGYGISVTTSLLSETGAAEQLAALPSVPMLHTLPPPDREVVAVGGAAPESSVGSFADSATVRKYSAWRHMIPRYWVPLAAQSDNGGVVWGASTSALDVIDRHGYAAELLYNSRSKVFDGSLAYTYSGLGLPVVSVGGATSSDYTPVYSGAERELIGYLREASQTAALGLRVSRPRYRTSVTASAGFDYERTSYDTSPAEIIDLLDDSELVLREFGAVSASVGFSNTQRPSLSISPEDGVSILLSARERWQLGASTGEDPTSRIVVGSLRAFKSLDLPGFSRHVLAARVAAGWASRGTTSRFSVGGKSGSRLELFPGYLIGDAARQFPVRGFQSTALRGLRAMSASVEYRAPLFMPSRGVGMFPFFVDRVSAALFADAGSAWCPVRYAELRACRATATAATEAWIASFGAELNFDTALQYDSPYRMRVGVARIARGVSTAEGRGGIEGYFTLGFPF